MKRRYAKPTAVLIDEFVATTNPVTRAVLRRALVRRIMETLGFGEAHARRWVNGLLRGPTLEVHNEARFEETV